MVRLARVMVRGDRCSRWGEEMGDDGGERVKLLMRAVAFLFDEVVGVMSRLARGLIAAIVSLVSIVVR